MRKQKVERKKSSIEIIQDFLELKDMLPDQKGPIKCPAEYKQTLMIALSF